jgi:hypothetical protein
MSHTLLATVFTDQTLTGTFMSRWIDSSGSYALNIHLSNSGSGAIAGAYTIEESNDPSIQHELKATDGNSTSSTAKVVDITGDTDRVLVNGTGLVAANGASTMITILTPARYVRVKYVGTGGTGAKLQGWVAGQG